MARDCRSVPVFVVLWWNSIESFGTLPGNTRPTKTARPTLPDSTLLLLQTINEIGDAEKRMKAIHALLEEEKVEKETEKEKDVLKERIEKEKLEGEGERCPPTKGDKVRRRPSASKGAHDCTWRL